MENVFDDAGLIKPASITLMRMRNNVCKHQSSLGMTTVGTLQLAAAS